MGATVFYVLMVQEYMFKAKVSEIKNIPCVQEIFKDFGAINMKKNPQKETKSGFNGYVYEFSVDYDIDTSKINIYKYQMKKRDIK